MNCFHSLSRGEGASRPENVVYMDGWGGRGWRDRPLVSYQRLVSSRGPRTPGRARLLPSPLSAAGLSVLGSEREEFPGSQGRGDSSADATKCPEVGGEKEEAPGYQDKQGGVFPFAYPPIIGQRVLSVWSGLYPGAWCCTLWGLWIPGKEPSGFGRSPNLLLPFQDPRMGGIWALGQCGIQHGGRGAGPLARLWVCLLCLAEVFSGAIDWTKKNLGLP